MDFSNLEVNITKEGGGTEVVKTCPAAMGFGFAAGTTDGPGAFDFTQGDDKVTEKRELNSNSLVICSFDECLQD